jgi:hypothetical protein
MPDLNLFRASLQQMSRQLPPLMDALLRGSPEDANERARRLRELETIQTRLKIMIRDLKSAQNLQDARQSALPNLPRDVRYSANQAIDQRQRDLNAMRKELEDFAAAVRDLYEANGFLSPAQRVMKINELVENLVKAAENQHALTELGLSSGPAITNVHESSHISGLLPMILFIYLAIHKLKNKSSGSETTKRR